jgi:hypothetical protein
MGRRAGREFRPSDNLTTRFFGENVLYILLMTFGNLLMDIGMLASSFIASSPFISSKYFSNLLGAYYFLRNF